MFLILKGEFIDMKYSLEPQKGNQILENSGRPILYKREEDFTMFPCQLLSRILSIIQDRY